MTAGRAVPPEPTPLVRGLHRLAAGLDAALGASRAIHHNLAAGEARELAVACELAPHFPSRFSLSSGIVVNAAGQESRQQDVLITDPAVGTPFVAEGNIGVHPIETIAATLQIKTSISPATIEEAVQNVSSVKRLLPDTARGFTRITGARIAMGEAVMKPFAGIVAFEASGGQEAIRRSYLAACARIPSSNRPNALFVLDEMAILWSPDGRPMSITENPSGARHAQTFAAGRDSILFFYVVLIKALNAYEPPPLDIASYLNAGMPPVTVFLDEIRDDQ